MPQPLDCVVIGSCVVDLLCRPVDLDKPIGGGVLHHADPVVLTAGGITMNSGVTMARLGVRVGVLTYVGNDAWAPVVRKLMRDEHIHDELVLTHATGATSTTVVLIDHKAERSFFHCVGAPKLLDAQALLERFDALSRAKYVLLGYYSLMPNLESDLPEVFRKLRAAGCKTAMDAAGAGGTMQPLDRILPHLDVYVPSLAEAQHQTGKSDPKEIIRIYRGCGAPGILGVKLGKQGVMLSPKADEYLSIPIVEPPAPLVDTTGAGDSFYGGFLAGLIKGLPLDQAGRLGAAAAACCVTVVGGSTGGRDYATTSRLAGLA